MKKLLHRYFVLVADKPFKSAGAISFMLTLPVLIAAIIIITDKAVLDTTERTIVNWSLLIFAFISLLNLIIPKFFVTHFFKNGRQIVLIRPEGDPAKSFIYTKPLWGKFDYIKIYFPEDWDLNDKSVKRELELIVAVPVDSEIAAFLKFPTVLSFGGNFLARDLEEMIKQQNEANRNGKVFSFRLCLQGILVNYLSSNKDWVFTDIVKWHNKQMKVMELEAKLAVPDVIFSNLFDNINDMKMRLLTPELTKRKEER